MAEETPELQPPLYLKQARIRDHAPLRDATVRFQPGLNVIIGANGSGKTRFLTLISQLADLLRTNEAGDRCELVFGYDADIDVSFHRTQADEMPDVLGVIKKSKLLTSAAYKGNTGEGEILAEALNKIRVVGLTRFETILAQHGTPLSGLLLADVAATLTPGDYGLMRWEPEIKFLGKFDIPLLVVYVLNTLNYVSMQRQRYRRTKKEKSAALLSAEIKEEIDRITTSYLQFISPILAAYSPIQQVRLSETYHVYDNPVQQEVIVKGLVFEYLVGGSWLPYQTLSDGTKRILYLVTQLVMPEPQFEPVDAPPFTFTLITRPRLIFLEEPELGIHPHQLTKLLNLIREVSRDNQVILTTHAPQVLDMLTETELDRITVCRLDPDKGTQFEQLSPQKQDDARTYMKEVGFLSDYWRYSFLEEPTAN